MQIHTTGIIVAILGVTVGAVTLGWRIGKNGSKAHGAIYDKIADETKDKIDGGHCHSAMESVNTRMGDFQKHVDTRFDDVIKLIEKNGK